MGNGNMRNQGENVQNAGNYGEDARNGVGMQQIRVELRGKLS